MQKWRVRITLEKEIEASDRGTAKALMVNEIRHPKVQAFCGEMGFYIPPETFSFTDAGKPMCIDVSASKIRK